MSNTIDEKVVEMRFDNRQFEQNVSTTMSTLDKLKQKLHLDGATKGLENIDAAARKVDMMPLADSVQTVGLKFNWLHTYADQTMRRITDSVNHTAKKIASALTIDPIKTGFSEYETKINSIQTIMSNTASKGTTMEDVTRVIGELNTYADKTIYNFAEMTRNIGTFTAAGVGLEESAAAIQGIANLAASSGSTSQQASTAMYQLSQALASGTVKLMDWNSVVNAGMGGEKFQDALKATAKEHGVAIDDIIAKNGSFRESLQEGWLSADILNETLQKFTVEGAKEYADSMVKSGKYTQEQADALIKEAQAMEDAATKVKTFTQLWDTLKESAQSGWSQSWEIIVGDFEEAKELLTQVSDVIGGMIGASADARNEMLQDWKTLGGRTELIEAIRNAFEGVISIVKPIKEAFREIFPPMTGEKLLAFTTGLKNLTAKLKIGDGAADKLKRTFKGLFAIVDIVKQVLGGLFKIVGSLFGGVGELGGGILTVTAKIGDFLVGLNNTIKRVGVVNKVVEWFRSLLGKLGDALSGIGGSSKSMKQDVSDAFSSMGEALESCGLFKFLTSVWNLIVAVGSIVKTVLGKLLGGLLNRLGNFEFKDLLDLLNALSVGAIAVGITKLIKGITGIFDSVGSFKESIFGIFDSVTDTFGALQSQLKAGTLMKIATAIALLVAALILLSTIDGASLASALGAITALFTELMVAMTVLSKLDAGGLGLLKTSFAISKLATSLLILSVALSIMGSLSLKEMGVALLGMTGGLMALVIAVHLLPESKVGSAAKAIKKLSTALLILSVAIKIMSTMSWEEMGVGLVTMATSLAVLVAAVNLLPKDTKKKVKGLFSLALALVLLASAIKIMSTMSWGEMAVGLVAMAAGLGLMVAAVNLLPKSTGLKVLGILSLAAAMVILAAALKIMATMSWEDVAISLVALAGSLIILAVAMNAMMTALPGAAAMLVVAPALVLLAAALKILGTMSLGEIVLAVIALGGALAVLAVAMNAMMLALPGAAAMLVVAAALAIFVPALLLLGSASIGTIATGLLALVATFAILGAAGILLLPLTPIILALSAAILLLGVGCLAAGAGILLLATGLSMLVSTGASVVSVVIGLAAELINLIPDLMTKVGEGVVALIQVMIDALPVIGTLITGLVVTLCDVLIKCVPKLIETLGVLLDALLEFIVEYIPKIVVAGMKLIIGLLEGIAANIPKIAKAGADIIIAFLRAMGVQIPRVVDAGMKMVIDLINGMANALRNNGPKFREALKNLVDAAFDAIGLGKVIDTGKRIMDGLVQGIKNGAKKVKDTLISTVKNAWNSVLDFLGINSPSRLAAEAGMGIDEGLAKGLREYSSLVDKEALGVGETAMDSLGKSIGDATSKVGGGIDLQPTIRPVLDLSEVRAGAATIGSMLNSNATVGATATAGAINASMNGRVQNGGNDDIISAIDKLRKDIAGMNTTTYQINGITYNADADVEEAFRTLTRAARVERRV